MTPEEIAAVLEAHNYQDDTSRIGDWAMQCGCGWKAYRTGAQGSLYACRAAHDQHRAEVLAALIAARLESVERERDRWKDRHARYRVMYRERFNGGLSNAQWHLEHCAAIDRAEKAEAALADLRAKVETLADELCDHNPGHGDFLIAGKSLRALLDGA